MTISLFLTYGTRSVLLAFLYVLAGYAVFGAFVAMAKAEQQPPRNFDRGPVR